MLGVQCSTGSFFVLTFTPAGTAPRVRQHRGRAAHRARQVRGPTTLSSQFAPSTWIRTPTTFRRRAAASSHSWVARHQPCAQARLKLIEHESTPWRCQWMKVRMPSPLNHTSTISSIGASKSALHEPAIPCHPSNARRAIACRAALSADACQP